MRRLFTIGLALGAATLGALPAQAADQTGTYTIGTTPGLSVTCSPDCLGVPDLNIGGYSFPATATAPTGVDIADASGGPVSFTVCQDTNADTVCGNTDTTVGPLEPRIDGCATSGDLTTATIPFQPDLPTSVFVRLVGVTGPIGCTGLGLGGTITLHAA